MLLSTHKLFIILLLTFLLVGSTAFGQTVVYVTPSGSGNQSGSSWGNALPGTQLQTRLAAATASTQFWIAGGRYGTTAGLSSNRSVSFVIPSGVQVYGGFVGFEGSLSDRELTQPSSTTFSGELGNADSHDDNAFHVVTFRNASTSTRLDGVVVTRGRGGDGAGIYINGSGAENRSDPTIANCYITDNVASYGGGIYSGGYQGSANPVVTNCVISRNRAYTNGGGVYNNGYQGQCNPVFTNCLSFSNVAADGGAYYNEAFSGTCNPIFKNCTIASNQTVRSYFDNATPYGSGAMYNDLPGNQGSCNPTLTNCLVWGNIAEFAPNSNSSIYNNGSVNLTITYSTIQEGYSGTGNDTNNPNLLADFRLSPNSPAIDFGDPNSTTATVSNLDADFKPRIRNNRIDRGAIEYRLRYGAGFRVHVSTSGAGDFTGSSWENAVPGRQFPDLLADVLAGTTFWVAGGIYKPTLNANRTKTFSVPSGVQVYGGFAGAESQLSERLLSSPSSTTLSGEIWDVSTAADNSYRVVTFKNASASTQLDGFVIMSGNANGDYPLTKGGGIYCDGTRQNNRCEPLITNCLITKNQAGSGGGLNSDGEQGNASPTVLNCVFEQNTASAGGGANNSGLPGSSSPTFTDCKFLNNTATSQGGGLYYGGYFSVANDNVKLTNCIFSGNTAPTGGGIFCFNSYSATLNLILTNCLFDRNYASDRGGAIYLNTSFASRINPILKNCTFSGNQAINSGGNFFGSIGSDTFCAFKITSSIIRDGGFGYEVNPNRIAPTYNITYSNIQGGFSGTGNIDADPLFVDPANGNYRLQPGSPSINTGDPASTTSSVSATDLAGNPRIDNAGIDMGAYERQTVTGPILTLKEGNWNDPFTWLYQQLPNAGDTILIRHRVGLPASYVGNASTVQYDANGQLVFSPNARLNLN